MSNPVADQERSRRWALAGLSLSMLLSSLDTSIANVALPTLAQAFRASFQDVQWIVLAYLLAVTLFIVGAGRLGDVVGRRRLLRMGLALFTTSSAACGMAPTLAGLIVARAVQGLSAAVLMALTVALVGETTPRGRTGSAMGLLGTASAVGTALGPSLGGALIGWLGWRAIFYVNVPLGLLALGLVSRHLPADARRTGMTAGGFDVKGTLLLGATLGAYALGMTPGHGAFGPRSIAFLFAALVGGGLFVAAESRAASPLLRLEMLGEGGLGRGFALSALVSTVMMATLVVGPFYLSRGLGLRPALVGLVMSVGPIVAALTGVPAGRLVDRLGADRLTMLGLVGMAAGSSLLSATSAGIGVAGYALPIAVLTAHYALFQTANNTMIMSGVHLDQRGVVSGVLSLARNLGLITGASVMGAVFALASGASDIGGASTDAAVHGMQVTFRVATVLFLVALGWSRHRAGQDRVPDVGAVPLG